MPVWAQKELRIENKKNNYIQVNNMIKGGVSLSDELPAEFFGAWKVTGRLTATNRTDLFKKKSNDIWVLQKNNDVITLTNPATGASSSITLSDIKGKTASFERKKITEENVEYERPQITIEGENFYGTDEFVMEEYKNGKLVNRDTVTYEITGQKLSGLAINKILGIE
jgi:hypothetical protein